MPKDQDLGYQRGPRSEQQYQRRPDQAASFSHKIEAIRLHLPAELGFRQGQVGVDAKELYLLHVARGHWTILEMKNKIVTLASQWTVTHVLVEDTASGMGLVQLLREQTPLPVFGDHPKDDKETRLSRHQGRFEAGRILLPVEAPWLADFANELLAFPNGRYDDQVDALLLFLDWFAKRETYLTPMSFPMPIIIPLKQSFFGDAPPLF
jgi:predicted phage terminase large subunit-like protein